MGHRASGVCTPGKPLFFPSSGALMAAQLCHNLALADAVYRPHAWRSLKAQDFLGAELNTIEEREVEKPENGNTETRCLEGEIEDPIRSNEKIEKPKTKVGDMMWRRTALFGHLFSETGAIQIQSRTECNKEEEREATDDREDTQIEVIQNTGKEQKEVRKDKGKIQKGTRHKISVKQLFGGRSQVQIHLEQNVIKKTGSL